MVKKLLVRLLNLVYVAAAAYAILCFVTKPLFKLSLSVTVKGEDLATLLPSGNDETEETTKAANYKLVYRDGELPPEDESSTEQFDVMSAIDGEMLSKAIGDIYIPLDVEISADKCFDLNNKTVLNDIVRENFNGVKKMVGDILEEKLPALVKEVVMQFATQVMQEQIQNQINSYFTGDGEAPQVDPEDVQAVVEDVYALLDGDGEVTASELSEAIMGSTEYVLVTDPLTQEDIATGKYYTKSGEGEAAVYTVATTYEDNVEYYTKSYEGGVLGILSGLKEDGVEGFQDVDLDSVSSDEIQDAMVEALQAIPGMTTDEYTAVEAGVVTAETDFTANEYYVYNSETSTYEKATTYNEGVTYYTKEVLITNIDDALAGLLEMFLGGDSGEEDKEENPEPEQPTPAMRGILREGDIPPEVEEEANEEAEDATRELIDSLLNNLIPFDVDGLDLSLGGYAPYILAGLVGLGVLPWALFALITVIRTVRPRKCWTKPWVVFVFGFLQLILGAGVTLGIKFGLPSLLPLVSGFVPAPFNSMLGGLTLELSTSCLIPSFIYLGMIVFTIIYAIFAHGVKKDYKEYKKDKRLAKNAAKVAN